MAIIKSSAFFAERRYSRGRSSRRHTQKRRTRTLSWNIKSMQQIRKRHTDEWKKKARIRMLGNTYAHGGLGRKLSEEHKKKIGNANSVALKGRKLTTNHKEKISSGLREKRYNNRGRTIKPYRIRKAQAEGSHSREEWEILKKFYGNICLCCRKQEPTVKLTEDHIVPISLGGSNFIENIQPLCIDCNKRKYTKIKDFRTITATNS